MRRKQKHKFIPKVITGYRDEERNIVIVGGGNIVIEVDRQAPARFDTGVRMSSVFGTLPGNFTDYYEDELTVDRMRIGIALVKEVMEG